MSTPATYQFIGQHPAPAATTLYLHLDGYEQGAANYFRAMLAQEEGPRVEAFMRANKQADLVTGHDVWNNALYRYTLGGEQIRAEKRMQERGPDWDIVFFGNLVDFINSQPGPMLHRHSYREGGTASCFTFEQIGEKVSGAHKDLIAAGNEPGQRNLGRAQRVLAEYKALALAAFRREEFGIVTAA